MLDHQTPDAVQQPAGSREEHQTVIKFVLSGPILGGHDAEVAQMVAPSIEVADLGRRVTTLERALADADARIDALSRALAATVAGIAAAPGNWTSRRTERVAKAPAAGPLAPEPSAQAAPEPAPAPIAFEPAPRPAAHEPAPQPAAFEPAPRPAAYEPAPQPAPYEPAARPVALHAATAQPVAPAPAPQPISRQPVGPQPIAAAPVPELRAPAPAAAIADPTPWTHASTALAHDTPAVAAAVRTDPIPLTLVESGERAPALRPSHPTPPKVRGLRRMISVLKNL